MSKYRYHVAGPLGGIGESPEDSGQLCQMFLLSSVPPELQMMVEHHLGQQQQGEEPEGATGSTETQEPCPTGITDVESKLGTSGKVHGMFRLGRHQAQKNASPDPEQEACSSS